VSAEQLPADKLIGQTLASRYEILHRLGEGAMGAVYKARHARFGRPFAVKVLHPRLLQDAKVAKRFEREAELAGRLRHANVVGVVDVGEFDGTRYMVMDFAEGPDLAQLLVEAPMPAERIIHLVRQLLEGLYHAHERGLIHRDFKPENVIIERDSHGAEMPRIVDFGIAILRDAGDGTDGSGRLTTNGLVLGTPHYMAPEQAVADPIDHRIDLFALGIVVYEMLSGRLPFDGSGAEVARANLLLDPPPIVQRVPYLEVDPLLEAFSRRLMAKKRDARPPTAKAARELLDLIEHDRRAAAMALGVATSERTPALTLPVSPQSSELAALPPVGATARMKPTPSPAAPARIAGLFADEPGTPGATAQAGEAQPVAAIAYLPPVPPVALPLHGGRRPTSTRTPLSWEAASIAKHRRPWLIGGGILGAAGIAAAVIVATADSPPPPPPAPADRIAVTPGQLDPASAPPVVEPSAPPPVAPVATPTTPTVVTSPPVEPAAAEPAAAEPATPSPPAAGPPAANPPPPSTADARVRVTRPVPSRPAAPASATPSAGSPSRGAIVDRAPAATPPDDGKATDRADSDAGPAHGGSPAAVKPAQPALPTPPMKGVSTNAISALYSSIPPLLKQLPEEQLIDLRERLRRYDVQALMLGPQDKRDAAAVELTEILRQARARLAAIEDAGKR
jgi:serine/threonine protein kinase